MSAPEPVASRPTGPPAPGGGWPLLDAQPFPCLVVETAGGRLLHANTVARQLHLAPAPGDAAAACYATDAEGGRVEAKNLARHLIGRACGPDGAEITWHTPERAWAFHVFCRPVPSAPGRPATSVLTFLDVSRQKETEEALRQALEARDEFFSVATHELKDPLFALQLSIQLLHHSAKKLGQAPPHVLQHLEVSQRQSERLARLIENLLDVSRIMNQRVQLDREAVDLAELAREAVARSQARAQAVGAALTAEAPEPLIVYADRLKLEQVVGNLLANALKYGAGRPVTVRVRPEGEAAVLEVEDHGPGIAPEDQERVFHRFERASGGHRRESLGLGLYIVRSLVEAHGGTVTLRSQPGQGATFTVTLPRARLHGVEDAGQESPTR